MCDNNLILSSKVTYYLEKSMAQDKYIQELQKRENRLNERIKKLEVILNGIRTERDTEEAN